MTVQASPFFRPTEKPDFTQTPGGTRHRRRKPKSEEENKSTLFGCSANLINAIVGSGIVGLPYAIQQAGFVAGIFLVVLCAILTEKSLRLLIETAKHVHVPSYETVAEAAFGKYGFTFVALNMFVMAYGAMLSYLMIVKDTFSMVFGVSADDLPMRRAILFIISISIIVPLSSQRDMADLAKTSRINVTFDLLMVLIVLYKAPFQESWQSFDWKESIIHYDTIFVGLGVLSFAFVCQHSAFIIAGSLEKPTKDRWAVATRSALSFCCTLALACGAGAFVGFQDNTQGNILNSLDDSVTSNIARGLLGTTMLFVYPMESFVARHVCVVLFFQGRSAHEGDDASVLNRRDRRITLTFLLYLISVIPAGIFQNVGTVLAAVGAVGGSCLSYIGPGVVYLGVHGGRFLELSKAFFGESIGTSTQATTSEEADDQETAPLYNEPVSADLPELPTSEVWIVSIWKNILWYLLLMPIWVRIANVGKSNLTTHISDLVIKSPHPIRIGNVRFATAKGRGGGATRVVMLPTKGLSTSIQDQRSNAPISTMLIRADSLQKGGHYNAASRTPDGQKIIALPLTPKQKASRLIPSSSSNSALTSLNNDKQRRVGGVSGVGVASNDGNYQSINERIGAMAKRKKQEEELALEDDPQQDPPHAIDFVFAISYIIFGVIAMLAGLFSIYNEADR